MEQALNAVVGSLLVGGVLIFIIAALGVIQLPDYFTRAHAVGMTDTLALFLTIGALIINEAGRLSSAKLVFLLLFLGIANPTVGHALMRAALRRGRQPWKKKKK